MTVGRNDSILDTVYMIHQIFDFRPIFVRQAINRSYQDIDNCRASLMTASTTRARYSLSVRPASSQ